MNARDRLRDFFFARSTATNLGVCRALFCGALFFCFFGYDPGQWAYWPRDAWKPVWFVGLIGPLPSATTLSVVGIVWKVSLIVAALGLFRLVSLGVALVLSAYVLGLTGSFVKDNYDVGLPVIMLFVLWVARSTDAFSLDAVIARRRSRTRPSPSSEYTWPIALGRVLLALAFFTAGIAKLRHSGLDWITSDSLRWLLTEQQYTHNAPLDWASAVANHPLLCHLLATGTVALEVSYPLALFATPLRPWIVLGTIGLQLGIHLLMGINYLAFLAVNVVWVDWEALWRLLRDKLQLATLGARETA